MTKFKSDSEMAAEKARRQRALELIKRIRTGSKTVNWAAPAAGNNSMKQDPQRETDPATKWASSRPINRVEL